VGNIFNKDFIEFIQCLNDNEVDYILVGGYSVILHGYPRTTGDLDIWVDSNIINYNKLERAFGQFRLPLFDMTLQNFLNNDKFDVFRFGRPPIAIDIITSLKGIEFKQSQNNAEVREFDGVEIKYLSFIDLISAKKSAGRAKDINDIENLENNI
tara:strand:- start:7 stop:468 length:462 start_codon:yes stop_codon:yes gene_type:complete